ncbi:MAG: aminoacyl-tRNA hydrolase [Spirochaetales bacterium]|nr:aminoacyl-tRNA hydrolase [Candidatus Physcosoma equi]
MFVFGLGNPGSEYHETRHNVGFMTVDKMAALKGVSLRKRCFCPYKVAKINSEHDVLVEPLTYMNRSGEVIPGLLKEEDKLLVIADQMDLPPGKVRIRTKGGSAGHNGLKSIIANWSEDFIHVYIGIGRPEEGVSVPDHVLSQFSEEDKVLVDKATTVAAEAILEILDGGNITEVIQRVNSFQA